MENAVAVQDQQPMALAPAMSVAHLKQQRDAVMQVMKEVMVKDQHYGTIPGTKTPILFKPGAEMLGMTFGLRATFACHARDLENGHREYTVDCTLTYRDGSVLATASGLCSTMESKYRWRNAKKKCLGCGRDLSRSDSEWYCWKKQGGCGKTYALSDRTIASQPAGKVENPDIADVMNTVMKMAAKRAHVACIRLALAVSDMFETEEEAAAAKPETKQAKPQQAKPTPQQELARECAQLASKLQRDRDSIAELLKERGGWAPKDKWIDLSVGELKKAREILAAEVELVGKGGK